jgi:hypothetical protein
MYMMIHIIYENTCGTLNQVFMAFHGAMPWHLSTQLRKYTKFTFLPSSD